MITGATSPCAIAVLAVLVIYRRPLAGARSWPTLRQWLADGEIRQCLVYDNSPEPSVDVSELPAGAQLIHDPANGGTAAAYAAAAELAATLDCDWLLLLDHDTALPRDYLARVAVARKRAPEAAALVPQVRHGDALVSPAVITTRGAVRPALVAPAGTIRTAISSGVLVQREALAGVLPFPPALWLDYLDHWIFRTLANAGQTVGDIDAVLAHDLSVRSPAEMSRARLANILDAEAAFHTGDPASRSWLRLRRLARAARYLFTGNLAHAGLVLYRAARTGGR